MRCNSVMRYALLLSFVLAAPTPALAQTTPAQTPPRAGTPAPAPRTGAPAPTQPRPRATAPAAASTRSGMAITVMNPNGGTIEGVHVQVTGPMERMEDTNSAGQV